VEDNCNGARYASSDIDGQRRFSRLGIPESRDRRSPLVRFTEKCPAMLKLTAKWAPILMSQPETGRGFQIATVFLRDGRQFDRVMIDSGYLTMVGESRTIPFEEADIERIVVNHGE
jgi:hypothetical protein